MFAAWGFKPRTQEKWIKTNSNKTAVNWQRKEAVLIKARHTHTHKRQL